MATKFEEKVLNPGNQNSNVMERAGSGKEKIVIKLSEALSGCISQEQADNMHKELKKMRNEWERNIY
jgi:hypothetical protein